MLVKEGTRLLESLILLHQQVDHQFLLINGHLLSIALEGLVESVVVVCVWVRLLARGVCGHVVVLAVVKDSNCWATVLFQTGSLYIKLHLHLFT